MPHEKPGPWTLKSSLPVSLSYFARTVGANLDFVEQVIWRTGNHKSNLYDINTNYQARAKRGLFTN